MFWRKWRSGTGIRPIARWFLTSDSNTAVRMITASLNGKASMPLFHPATRRATHPRIMDYKNHYKDLYRAIMVWCSCRRPIPCSGPKEAPTAFWRRDSVLVKPILSATPLFVTNTPSNKSKLHARVLSSSLLRLQGSVSGSSRTSQTEEHTRSEETDQQNNAHNNDNDKSVARLLTEDGDEHLHLGVSNNVTGNPSCKQYAPGPSWGFHTEYHSPCRHEYPQGACYQYHLHRAYTRTQHTCR